MAEVTGRFREPARAVERTPEYNLSRATNQIAIDMNNRLAELGLTRTELASRLRIGKSAISQMLSSDSNPKLSTLAKLASALGVELQVRFVEPDTASTDEPKFINDLTGLLTRSPSD